ncbi:MAG: MBL fold metallo-hydrolase [Rhodothermaceae bacterium]|nr:MBL fold metallo-hydrolase [Rhodothermaceae bacterium]
MPVAVYDTKLPEGTPERMRVRFWGVRGSIPTPQAENLGVGGNTACVEVRLPDGSCCAFDAGTGARPFGAYLLHEADGAALDLHLFLSHFHWDHIQGLPFFAPLYAPTSRLTIYASDHDGPPADLITEQMQEPFFPVAFEELPAETRIEPIHGIDPVRLDAATVHPFPVHHTQFVLGYRLESHNASVVYCTDYEHGDAELDALLVETAAGADLLICDAQYTPEEYATRQGWGHTTWEWAARLAREAEVGHLALFHHDPAHDDEMLAQILEAAQGLFPHTILATEGVAVDL